MDHSQSIEADAIIIGAGITGLVTAYGILERDPNLAVLIIEAENCERFSSALLLTSGGKHRTFPFGRPQTFNEYHENVFWLVNRLHLSTTLKESKGTSIVLNAQGKKETYLENIPSTVYPELTSFLKTIENLGASVPVWDPWLFPGANFADKNSIETIIQHTLPSHDIARQWARTIVRELVDQEAHDVSILSFGAFLNACGGWQKAFGINQETKNYSILGDLLKIEEMLIKSISEDNLIYHEKIVTIYNEFHWVKLVSSSNRTFKCRQVILAISPKEVLQINFQPEPLTENHRKTFEKLLRTPKLGNTYWLATYSRTFWRIFGDNGHIVVNTDSSQMEFRGAWDASTENTPALGGLVRCDGTTKGMFERRQDVLEALAAIWGSNALLTLDYTERPFEELQSRFTATWAPGLGVGPGSGELLRSPWRNVVFAFPFTATCWPGFLEGDIQVGRRCAIEALYVLRPQTLEYEDFILVSPPSHRKRKRRIAIEDDSSILNKQNIIWTLCLALVAGVIIYKIKKK